MAQIKRPTGPIANKGIELLTAGTPNGFKASILLEELKEAYGEDYTYQRIDIFGANDQKEPWFTKLGPNGRIPVIVDHNKGGLAVMESLAIYNYLTRHYDPKHKFSFEDPIDICIAEQWLAWQHGNLASYQAQTNFYYRFAEERYPFPTQRFFGETERLYGVLDTRFTDRDYVAGPGRGKYSIADMALFPFIHSCRITGIELERFPNVYRWWALIYERPAVRKGLAVPNGQEFPYGYNVALKRVPGDILGVEQSEERLREILQKAQKEFKYVYRNV